MRRLVLSSLCFAFLAGGCRNQGGPLRALADADGGPDDAGVDAGAADSGTPDQDSGFLADSGAPDAGAVDAGPDAGPDGGPAADSGPPTPSRGYQNLVSGDLNGDGMLDLVAGWVQDDLHTVLAVPWASSGFDVFYGLADGGLSSPTSYAGGSDGMSFALADLNGDGLVDLVASNVTEFSVYLALADEGFAAPVAYSFPSPISCVFSVGIGDFSGTGRKDLIFAGDNLYLSTNAGDGTFSGATKIAPQLSTYASQLLVLDLNNDGFADLLVVGGASGDFYALLNEQDGGFALSSYSLLGITLAPIPPIAQPMVLLSRPGGRMDVALSTCALPAPGTWQVVVFSTVGDGSLASAGLFPIFSPYDNGESYMYPGFIASADLDGDGFLDLALSGSAQTTDDGFFVHFVQVLYGNDAGGFGQPQLVDTTGKNCPAGVAALGSVAAPHAVAIADFCGGGITVIGDASKH